MAQRKVLVSLLNEQQEFQQLQAAEARAAGGRVGLEVEILWCQNDPTKQARQLSEAVAGPEAGRPAAIVMEPAAAAGLDGLGRLVAHAGVGWVTLGDRAQAMDALRGEFQERLIATVGTDNDEIGRLQAKLVRKLLPRGGRVVTVEGPSFSHAAIHRRKSMEAGLLGSGIELGKALPGDWTSGNAERAARFWLRLGGKAERPHLVASQNDEMAVGARKAFQEIHPEWNEVLYTGVDGLPGSGQRLVQEKVLAATVVTPAPTGLAVEMVARALAGEVVPAFTLVPPHPFPPL